MGKHALVGGAVTVEMTHKFFRQGVGGEFGTGLKRINGPTEHPEADEYGYGFRTFSAKHQKYLWNPRFLKKYKGSWFEPIYGKKVSGNPPAMGWYKARELIKNHSTIQEAADTVFNVFGHTN